jgi:hypothetical protein
MDALRAAESLFLLLLMGAGFLALAWFLWRVFLRRYLRIVRIRHLRDRRLTEEAVRRQR